MKWCLAATILAAAAAAAFIGSPVNAALTIKRNTQDCIYPRIGADAERLWPTSKYLPKGPVAKALNGGFLVSCGGVSVSCHTAGPPPPPRHSQCQLLLLFPVHRRMQRASA